MSSAQVIAERDDATSAGRREWLLRANQARCLAPTQHHPRQCRCDRPLGLDSDDCFRCGLPVQWMACDPVLQAGLAEHCAREHATATRRAYRRRTGR